VKVDEASEMKKGQVCTVGAEASRLMAKGSRLMASQESTNGANKERYISVVDCIVDLWQD